MLIAKATSEAKRDVLILGLTDENIRRMQTGKPLYVSEGSLPPNTEILIFIGRDDQTIKAAFEREGFIGT